MQRHVTIHDESPREAAAVLAIDLDDLTLERVRAAVRGTELGVAVATPAEALERARTSNVPSIFLLEWGEEQEEEAAAFCDALRGAAGPERCYILALGGVTEQSALLRAMGQSADGVLRRPFGSEWLLVYLRQAMRAMAAQRGRAMRPRDALDEALRSPEGGEVVLRSGDVTGHIHVQSGHVVWAHVSSAPATMEEVARHGDVSLDQDVIAAVRQECRATGAHFMEVLVSWGVIAEDRAREAVRSFVAERVKLIVELPGAVALFLPKARPHTGRLRFRASEIPSLRMPPVGTAHLGLLESSGPPSSRGAPPLPLTRIAEVVGAAMRLDGALGAGVLDRKTGAFLFHSGQSVDTEVAWSLVAALARLGPAAEEVIATAGEHHFLVRPLRNTPSLILFLALSSSSVSLGLAKLMAARIAAADGDPDAPGGPSDSSE